MHEPPHGLHAAEPEGDHVGRRELERALQRILWELRPYLRDVVVIGGWVPYLYQRYGPFPGWRGRLALTAEVDVLVSGELPRQERQPISKILESAGFSPVGSASHPAVWAGPPERGEKVEFLVPHAGTFRDLGRAVPVGAQSGIGAISLTALDIMQRHTGTLPVFAQSPDGDLVPVDVRVPRLGGYTINKAATFPKRTPFSGAELGGTRSNPKKAKDLLYLRDLMQAGSDVLAAIERDIEEIVRHDAASRHLLDTAASNLDAVTRVSSRNSALLQEVGAMLAEREPNLSHDAATANVAGLLTDLADILLRFRSQLPVPDEEAAGEDRSLADDS